MSEAELIDQMIARQDIIWSLNQWWVSISLAVMLAAFVASDRLNKVLVTLIIFMYSLYTFTLWDHVLALVAIAPAYSATLSALAESSQLSAVGYAMIESRAGRTSQIVFPVFMVAAFLVTNGFVLYCFRRSKRG